MDRRWLVVLALALTSLFGSTRSEPAVAAPATAAVSSYTPPHIGHVWTIILENKSYEATFSGLNQNSYLGKALPSYGELLRQYYGTGHYSLDNYTSLVAGQSPAPDNQADCGQYTNVAPGFPASDGQVYASTGCVYPKQTMTLFNQLQDKKVSWKAYMQDMGNDAQREDPYRCGIPGSPEGAGVVDPGGAIATDQYVPKHNPTAWFHSLIDSKKLCRHPGRVRRDLSGDPDNKRGGLYAADRFLEKWVPQIMASPAFQKDGEIQVIFDEAFPPYTMYGNSIADFSYSGGARRGHHRCRLHQPVHHAGLGQRPALQPLQLVPQHGGPVRDRQGWCRQRRPPRLRRRGRAPTVRARRLRQRLRPGPEPDAVREHGLPGQRSGRPGDDPEGLSSGDPGPPVTAPPMTWAHGDRPRGRAVRRVLLGALAAAVVSVGLAGCGASPAPSPTTPVRTPADPDPSAVVSALGAVPIPPSSAPVPTPRASAGHPVLSAAGGPVEVSLGPDGRALVTMLGPEQADQGTGGAPGAGPQRWARAVVTLQVRQLAGGMVVRADELSSRDETGRAVRLSSVGPTSVTTRAGRTSTLAVSGTFDSGSAQVTWRHRGRVLAVWTFTIGLG